MAGSRQRDWATDFLEGSPSIVFLALWQSNVNLELAGWAAAALAAIVLIGFRIIRRPYSPIVLGINVHLLIITPLIVALFHFGAYNVGKTMLAFAYRGVLVTVFLVGCALTAVSQRGFIGIADLPAAKRLTYSLILLAASTATVAWAFAYKGTASSVAIAIPLMALFGLRRLLVARWLDRNDGSSDLLMVAPASAFSAESAGTSQT